MSKTYCITNFGSINGVDVLAAYHRSNSSRTALKRSCHSYPPRLWSLIADGVLPISGHVLDFGCGHFNDYYFNMPVPFSGSISRYDPYNLPYEDNCAAIKFGDSYGGFDYIVCSNVLNVIDTDSHAYYTVNLIHSMLAPGGTAYFTVYEGDKSGEPSYTKKGFQRNMPFENFYNFIRTALLPCNCSVTKKHRVIIVKKKEC